MMKKKWLQLSLCMAFIVAFAACGSPQDENTGETEDKQEKPKPEFLMQRLNVVSSGTVSVAANIDFGFKRTRSRFCEPGAGICEVTTGMSISDGVVPDTIRANEDGFLLMKVQLANIPDINKEFRDLLTKTANGEHAETGDYGGVLQFNAPPYTCDTPTMRALGLSAPFTIDNNNPILVSWLDNNTQQNPDNGWVTIAPIGAIGNRVVSVNFLDVTELNHCGAISITPHDENTINPGYCTIHTWIDNANGTVQRNVELFMNISGIDSLGPATRALFSPTLGAIDEEEVYIEHVFTIDDSAIAEKLFIPMGWQTMPNDVAEMLSYNDGWISMMLTFVNPDRPINTDE